MLFSQPDYAPDLEWMLQSGQVSPELLLEALIQEFYLPIYRFVDAYLDNHRLGIKVANETFSTAINELHTYRPQDGVDIWLFRIAIRICQKWLKLVLFWRSLLALFSFLSRPDDFGDSLPENEVEAQFWLGIDALEREARKVVLLYFLSGWSIDQIATLTNGSVDLVNKALEKAYFLKTRALKSDQYDEKDLPEYSIAEIEQEIITTLQKRWSVPKTKPDNIDRLIGNIGKRAGRISKRRFRFVHIVEIAVIALIILIGSSLAWETNRLGSARVAKTPSQLVITVIITEYVYEVITGTPAPLVVQVKDTPTPNLVMPDRYIVAKENNSLEYLGEREGVSAKSLRDVNRIPEEQHLSEGDRLLLPQYWSAKLIKPKRKQNLTEPITPLEPPILSESILRRLAILGVQYDTLWLEAQIIDYGPESYIGPARVLRTQIWMDQNQFLSLIGYPDRLPTEALLQNSEGTFIAKPASSQPWFFEWNDYDQDQDESLTIKEQKKMVATIFDTQGFERGYTFADFGRETQAGILALKFDVINSEGKLTDRIWYDDQRGLVLRRIQFSPANPNTPLFEVQVKQVAYNTTLPGDFFDAQIPWRGGFAQDASGKPAALVGNPPLVYNKRTPLPHLEMPVNLDPAFSILMFQYPLTYPVDSPYAPVEMFGNHFFIDTIEFGNPWSLNCNRSPDGNWLAFDSPSLPPYTYTHVLRLVNLANITAPPRHIEQSENVSVFAFSPDSQSIAFFSPSKNREKGTLFVYNLSTAELKPIMNYFDVKSLVWNPDGTSLGMIARPEVGSYADYVVVYDLQMDKITYSTPVDYESNAFQEWPMLKWGIEFPVEMGEMDDCAKPPAG